MWVLLYIAFFIATRPTVGCLGPIYFIIYVFHHLIMLMFDVLVKSFVLAEVEATTLTF